MFPSYWAPLLLALALSALVLPPAHSLTNESPRNGAIRAPLLLPFTHVDWEPQLVTLPGSGLTLVPLVLTAPVRLDRARWLAQAIGMPDVHRVAFPAPMAFDPFSGAGEYYRVWKCAKRFRQYEGFRSRAMHRYEDAAVFLGHARMIRFFLEHSRADFLLVLEDDAAVFGGAVVDLGVIQELIEKLVQAAPQLQPWDVLNLGRLNYERCKFDRPLMTLNLGASSNEYTIYRPGGLVWGTQALLYHRKGAERIFAQIRANGPVVVKGGRQAKGEAECYPFDEWLAAGNRNQLTLHTPLFVQEADLRSLREPDAAVNDPNWVPHNSTLVVRWCERPLA
eukprot:jgi/Mesvir1/15350/Mv06554-RA.1